MIQVERKFFGGRSQSIDGQSRKEKSLEEDHITLMAEAERKKNWKKIIEH